MINPDRAGADDRARFVPDQIKRTASTNQTDAYAVPVDPMDELGCDSCQ